LRRIEKRRCVRGGRKKDPNKCKKDLVVEKRFYTFAARLIEDGSFLKVWKVGLVGGSV
jgi:hypothetical protein